MSLADQDLAREIVRRLNRMIDDPAIASAIAALIRSRTAFRAELHRELVSALIDHPTLQVGAIEGVSSYSKSPGVTLGALGFLNGIVGAISGGEFDGWGHITAVLADDGSLSRFEITGESSEEVKPCEP